MIECEICGDQYNGSIMTKFCARAITIKSHIAVFKKNKNYQIKIIFTMTIMEFWSGRLQ